MKRDVLSVAMSVALVTVYSPAAFADSQLNFKIYSPGASSSTAAPKPADVQPAPDQPATDAPAEAKAPSSDDIVTASDHKIVESDSTASSDKPNDTATADSGASAPMLQSETPAADATPVQPASSVFDTTQAPATLNAAQPAAPAATESASAPAPAATESASAPAAAATERASAPAQAAAPVITPAQPVAPVTTALPAASTDNAEVAGAANAAVDPAASAPAPKSAAAPANDQTAAATDAVDPSAGESGKGADGKQIASKTLQGYVRVVPTGTKIPIIMDTAVDSDTSQEGDEFEARTAEDLSIDGSVVVPAGSVIHGRIATLAAPKALLRNGSVALKFDTVTTPDNRQLPLTANLVARGGVVHARRGMKDIAIDAGVFSAPALAGLAIGAVAGHSSSKLGVGGGALIGVGVGAAVGVAVLLARKGKRIEVRPGDELKIELAEDLRMPTM
jgi:hypothetical protein